VRRNAGPARLLDRAAQRVGLLSPELRDGDSQLLPLRVAAEVINAEVSAGITLEEGAVRALHIQGEVEVIRAGKLFLGADQVGELDRDGIARLDGSQLFLRQPQFLTIIVQLCDFLCRFQKFLDNFLVCNQPIVIGVHQLRNFLRELLRLHNICPLVK